MNVPFVSIIVNNYNYGRFLREAIDSALSQTFRNKEVIVVDDGSIDESREIIDSYGDRVLPVFKSNGGQGSAFNAGFAISRGEIVIFVDADDALLPQCLQRVVEAWTPDTVKLHYRLRRIDPYGVAIGFIPPMKDRLDRGEVWKLLVRQCHYTYPPTTGNAFSRAALSRVMPMPEAPFVYSADAYLIITLAFYGNVTAIDEVLGEYRIHGNNGWMFTGWIPTPKRARRTLETKLREMELVVKEAEKKGCHVDVEGVQNRYDLVVFRIGSLRYDSKTHPIATDRLWEVLAIGIRSVCMERGVGLGRKAVRLNKLVVLSFLPDFLLGNFIRMTNGTAMFLSRLIVHAKQWYLRVMQRFP